MKPQNHDPKLPGLGRLPRDKAQKFEGEGSHLENQLLAQIREAGLPEPILEFQFKRNRAWRFDFAWPQIQLAIEVQGGVWMKRGRHTTGDGFSKECVKRRHAALNGWIVLEFTGGEVQNKTAIREIAPAVLNRFAALEKLA